MYLIAGCDGSPSNQFDKPEIKKLVICGSVSMESSHIENSLSNLDLYSHMEGLLHSSTCRLSSLCMPHLGQLDDNLCLLLTMKIPVAQSPQLHFVMKRLIGNVASFLALEKLCQQMSSFNTARGRENFLAR